MPRILLVDDESAILAMLEGILAAPDREFLLAGTAAQAEELAAKAGSVEVALVDKNLPDRSGLEVARALKRLHPDVEIILLTGYASLDSAIEAIQVGAFDYLEKPIEDFGDLALKVQNAADKVRLKREQRSLLERYAESEERYRGVFQATSEALLVADAETGRIQDANPAAERIYGYLRSELCQLDLSRLRAQGDLHPPAAASAAETHLRKDGSPFAAEVSCGQFLFHRQRTRIWSVRDVSERAKAEQERRALEEQVRHSQKMDAIGRLASGVAHDFNNLLTVILGNTELVLGGHGSPSLLHERLKEVQEAGVRAAALTRQLLAFSRKKEAQLVSLDLNAAMADMQKMLRRMIGENIELAVVPAPGLWRARADADQVGQVLLNLAVNARDAMPQGGKLLLETANVELDGHSVGPQGLSPGRYVRLAVTDNGIGMSPEVRKRIFEPFFTTKEPGKGTGLGLATVWSIAQRAGGAVSVYSEERVGTTFKVYLPATEASSMAASQVELEPPRRGQGEQVLLAEDNDAVRAMVGRVLIAHGYRVIETRNGEEGTRALSSAPTKIDLLITDAVMPRRSGRDLAAAARAAFPGIRVLFVSGYAEHAAVELGHLGQGEAFLSKPFAGRALLAKVGELLAPKPAAASRP